MVINIKKEVGFVLKKKEKNKANKLKKRKKKNRKMEKRLSIQVKLIHQEILKATDLHNFAFSL